MGANLLVMLVLFVVVALVMAFALAALAALGPVMLLREASREIVSRIEELAGGARRRSGAGEHD